MVRSNFNTFDKDYVTPGHPIAFAGLNKIMHYYNNEIKLNDVKNKLEKINIYSTHYQSKKAIRNPYFVVKKRQQFQIDLIDIKDFKYYNKGTTFLLTCIDVFTKRAFVRAIKSKKADDVLLAFKSIIAEAEEPPETLISDKGSEIKNKKFNEYLITKNIKQWFPENEVHASVVERFNKTFEIMLYKYIFSKHRYINKHTKKNIRQKGNFTDQLANLVKTYNSSYHRTIKMTPYEAELDENRHELFMTHDERYQRILEKAKKINKLKLNVDDKVRIKKQRAKFLRSYQQQFQEEIYIIHKINNRQPITTYIIKDYKGDIVKGSFYYSELVKLQDTELYTIETILKRKKEGKHVLGFIKWKGWDAKHNSWIRLK